MNCTKPKIQLRFKVPEWVRSRLPIIHQMVKAHSPLVIPEPIQVIGLGTNSAVILALRHSDNSQWALKIVQSGSHGYLKEEAILRHITSGEVKTPVDTMDSDHSDHSNQVRHLPSEFYSIPTVGLALPRLTILSNQQMKSKIRNDHKLFLDITSQVITALEQLHRTGLLHRDIKPENIAIGNNGQVCLIDFDLSGHMTTRTQSRRRKDLPKAQNISCGTPYYASLGLHFGGRLPNAFDDIESAIFSLWEVVSPIGLPWESVVNQSNYYRQSDLIPMKAQAPGIPLILGQLLTYVRETSGKRGCQIDYQYMRDLVGHEHEHEQGQAPVKHNENTISS